MAGGEESRSIEYTPTWIVAVVCSIIVTLSLAAERGLHHLGKILKRNDQDLLFEALQKLKEGHGTTAPNRGDVATSRPLGAVYAFMRSTVSNPSIEIAALILVLFFFLQELMLLGFISLLLTVSQSAISKICIPSHMANYMLPCKMENTLSSTEHYTHSLLYTNTNGPQRRLLSSDIGAQICARKGQAQMFSVEGMHQLHIFVFVLALVHVVFCATTMVLAGAKIREWKRWEETIRHEPSHGANGVVHRDHHRLFFTQRAIIGHYRKLPVVRWIRSFFKQFYGSVTKSDYIALRLGFIREHCPTLPKFDFHGYILRTLEHDFKKIVGISWYLWLFVVIFLLMNISGWHTYFWLSFLPLVLLLLVGAKLEHIITRLAREVVERPADGQAQHVKPSDEHFWFNRPRLVLYLIHFILFQNAFEIAFFIWIWTTYGFTSCVMEKIVYIIPRLVIGVIVQVLCSYSTLPLYAIVTQMGSMFKPGIFNDYIQSLVVEWAESIRGGPSRRRLSGTTSDSQMRRMEREPPLGHAYFDQESIIELSNTLQTVELESDRQMP